MTKTEQFLQEAFAGESQANRRYLAFAAKADQEGLPLVARLFRAAAETEIVYPRIILGLLTMEIVLMGGNPLIPQYRMVYHSVPSAERPIEIIRERDGKS